MTETLNLTSGNQSVSMELQPWDSQILQRKCARIVSVTGEAVAPDFGRLALELEGQGLDYVTVRIPQEDRARIQSLTDCGFEIVDGIVAFSKVVDGGSSEHYAQIRLATPQDAKAVAELASRTFRFSRFHMDPAILREQADRVHYEWAWNSCIGEAADAVWIWEEKGSIGGFSTVALKEKSATIVLVAVDDSFSGKGIAGKLTAKCCDWVWSRGISRVRVQTQSHNVAAQTVYRRAGFHVENVFSTLRWARGQVPYNLGRLATESFLQLQATFFNELDELATELGADIEQVWAAVKEDWRIGANDYNPLRDSKEDEHWAALCQLLKISRRSGFDFRLLQAAAAHEDPIEYLRLKISAVAHWRPAARKSSESDL